MTGKRPSADILPFNEWRDVLRAAPEPEPNAMVIAAAENARLVEALAQRNREVMGRLAELPCDVAIPDEALPQSSEAEG